MVVTVFSGEYELGNLITHLLESWNGTPPASYQDVKRAQRTN